MYESSGASKRSAATLLVVIALLAVVPDRARGQASRPQEPDSNEWFLQGSLGADGYIPAGEYRDIAATAYGAEAGVLTFGPALPFGTGLGLGAGWNHAVTSTPYADSISAWRVLVLAEWPWLDIGESYQLSLRGGGGLIVHSVAGRLNEFGGREQSARYVDQYYELAARIHYLSGWARRWSGDLRPYGGLSFGLFPNRGAVGLKFGVDVGVALRRALSR